MIYETRSCPFIWCRKERKETTGEMGLIARPQQWFCPGITNACWLGKRRDTRADAKIATCIWLVWLQEMLTQYTVIVWEVRYISEYISNMRFLFLFFFLVQIFPKMTLRGRWFPTWFNRFCLLTDKCNANAQQAGVSRVSCCLPFTAF